MMRRGFRDDDAKTYKTEAEMCAEFIAGLKDSEWTPYPECEGWDILLVHVDGRQVGIEAKLKPTLHLLWQATRRVGDIGPDFIAVLIPTTHPPGNGTWRRSHSQNTTGEFIQLCHKLLVAVIDAKYPNLEFGDWHRQACFTQRHRLPQYQTDVRAGVPCPPQLTPWKIKAIHLCRLLRSRGYLIKDDFAHFKVSFQRWPQKWLQRVHLSRPARYVGRPGIKLPDEDHPTVSAQIDREMGITPQTLIPNKLETARPPD